MLPSEQLETTIEVQTQPYSVGQFEHPTLDKNHKPDTNDAKEKVDGQDANTGPDSEAGQILDFAYPKFDDMRAGKIALILFSLGLASFLYAIEETIVSTSVSAIGSALQTTGSLTWITSSYLLTTTVCQPIVGRLADAVGAKRLLIIEIWLFILGNVIAGLSKSLNQLIAGRLISGVGGAGLLSLSTILVIQNAFWKDLTNERQRGSYLNLINLVFTVADAMGPVVGGGFSKSGNWRWIFLFNAPFGPVITLVLLWALRLRGSGALRAFGSPDRRTTSVCARLAQLDFAGMLTLIATLTFLTVGLNLGGQSLPWNSATIIGMFCAAFISFVAFIVVENYFTLQPVAPIKLFVQWRWRNVPITILVRCLLFFHLFSMTFYLPLFLQVLGISSINAAALVIPFLSIAAIASTATNYVAYHTGMVRPPFVFSLIVLPVGMGLMSTLDGTSSIGRIVGYSLISGFGFGCGTQISVVIAQVGLPTTELSTITALIGSAPNLGGVLGIGIIGNIINNTFRTSFIEHSGAVVSSTLAQDLNDVVRLIEHAPQGVDRTVVVAAYVHAWRTGCRVLAGIAVLQLLLSALLRPVEMDKVRVAEQQDTDC